MSNAAKVDRSDSRLGCSDFIVIFARNCFAKVPLKPRWPPPTTDLPIKHRRYDQTKPLIPLDRLALLRRNPRDRRADVALDIHARFVSTNQVQRVRLEADLETDWIIGFILQ
jgi:hypothetical protein